MRYPLRNPIEIAQKAHRVSQDGAKNRLDSILQNKIQTTDTNIIQGKFIKIEEIHTTWYTALKKALENIRKPKGGI